MKRLVLFAIVFAGLAVGIYLVAPVSTPLPEQVILPAATPAPEEGTLQTNLDAVEVFRRAFWRDPAAADHILHAERREWVSEENGVRRWQWFIAVEPGLDLATW